MDSILHSYFADFLPTLVGQELIPNLKGLSTTFRIDISDLEESYVLSVDSGHLLDVQIGFIEETDCVYTLKSKTFLEIAAGKLAPQTAFFKRQVHIGGKIEAGLKLAFVLGRFFKEHPWVGK